MSHHETLRLYDYQEAILDKLREGFIAGHRVQMLVAPTGAGKSLRYGTPVIMADGTTKAIQDVLVGDQLLGPDGGVRNVIALGRGQETMYEVMPVKGDPYYVNASHILSLRKTPGSDGIFLSDGSHVSKSDDIVNVNVETFANSNATARHCLKGWRSGPVEFKREEVIQPIPPYILGAWLGDGSHSGPTLNKGKVRMVDAWIEYGKSIGLATHEYKFSDQCSGWRLAPLEKSEVRNNPARVALKSLGLIRNKHIPDAYKYGTVAQRLSLLAGLLDSDGHSLRGGYDWISKDKRMAEDFAFICRSVGLAAHIKECRKGIKSTGFYGTYYRVSVSGDCERIPCLDKKAEPRKQIKRHLVTGLKLKRLGVEDYYGVVLDGDHLFLLGDFTVTHNTEMAMELLEAASMKGNRAAMVLDRVVLCNQTSERLDRYGMDHGVLQSGHWRFRPDKLIQVCSAQTLERRGSFPNLKLLIVDEAHQTRKQTIEFIRNNPFVKVIGLSATPFTKGLGRTYTNVVSAVTTKELVERGRLAPLRVFIAKEIDMSGAKKVAGEWSQNEASTRGMQITGDVVAEWAKKTHEIYGGPRKTVVFASGVEHAADLARKFQEAGFNFVALSYRDDGEFKADVIKDFARPDTEIHGLIATDILTKGFDVPDVLIGISARPFSKSFSSHVQQMGRVMRTAPGKDFATWLCNSGNYLRFKEDWDNVYENGVTEIDEGLDKPRKEKTKKEKESAKCPSCSALFPGGMDVCPSCGFVRAMRQSMITSVPGEMEELGDDSKADKDRGLRQHFYSQLLGIAQSKGYKDGWASHKYRDRFGVWPRMLNHNPIPPEPSMWRWLAKQQQIRGRR